MVVTKIASKLIKGRAQKKYVILIKNPGEERDGGKGVWLY